MLSTDSEKLDGMQTYIDGKMQRYRLLFAVNGGAFAIATVLTDPKTNAGILGALDVRLLGYGVVAFTALMWLDIWEFGCMMREQFFGEGGKSPPVFGAVGRAILTALAALLVVGWLLAARDAGLVRFAIGLFTAAFAYEGLRRLIGRGIARVREAIARKMPLRLNAGR